MHTSPHGCGFSVHAKNSSSTLFSKDSTLMFIAQDSMSSLIFVVCSGAKKVTFWIPIGLTVRLKGQNLAKYIRKLKIFSIKITQWSQIFYLKSIQPETELIAHRHKMMESIRDVLALRGIGYVATTSSSKLRS